MQTRLVFESKPWLEAFVGVLFLAGGTWALVSGEPVFGGGFIIAGVILIAVFTNIVTSTFDKAAGTFTRSTRGIIRRQSATYPLKDVTRIRLEAGNSAESPSKSHRVVVVLKSGKRVPLLSGFTSGKADKERMASDIRRFLDLPDTPEPDPPGFRDMIKMIRP